jgi:hypothetical protein
MTLTVSTPRAYPVARTVLEHHALDLQQRNPSLHLSMACQLALEQHPVVWRVYRSGIRHGLAPEFQRPKRRPSQPTPVDRAYFVIEDLGRALVGASETPITLRHAVVRVVETNPRLLETYRRAIRQKRRAKRGRA